MTHILRGFVAGALGVIGMAGTSFTMRRLVEPTAPIAPTHYEKVVASARSTLQPEAEPLDRDRQVRLGEISHLAFGGVWGVVFAIAMRHRAIRPVVHGLVFGTGVWALAFGGYMPKLKISRGLAEMDAYEAARTWICHVVYAGSTALILQELRRSRPQLG